MTPGRDPLGDPRDLAETAENPRLGRMIGRRSPNSFSRIVEHQSLEDSHECRDPLFWCDYTFVVSIQRNMTRSVSLGLPIFQAAFVLSLSFKNSLIAYFDLYCHPVITVIISVHLRIMDSEDSAISQ